MSSLTECWRPGDGQGGREDLAEVEASVLRICREYGAKLRFDRMQAEQLIANLQRQGVRCEEYVFSAAGANQIARRLWGALRDRALVLPDDAELREEFLTVRLVETGPATVKLSNPAGYHADIVTAVGMVAADLLGRPEVGRAGISIPRGTLSQRGTSLARSLPGRSLAGSLITSRRSSSWK